MGRNIISGILVAAVAIALCCQPTALSMSDMRSASHRYGALSRQYYASEDAPLGTNKMTAENENQNGNHQSNNIPSQKTLGMLPES